MEVFEEAAKRGVIIINITQCARGTVSASYAPGKVSVSSTLSFPEVERKNRKKSFHHLVVNLTFPMADLHKTNFRLAPLQLAQFHQIYLPPTNEVWDKVICLQVCVCPWGGGAWSWGVPGPGGAWSRGGAWWRPPQMTIAAGGVHPTGMHSCSFSFYSEKFGQIIG